MESKYCPSPEYAAIEDGAIGPPCGQPTSRELFGVTTLSCCDDHPTTYIGVPCRPLKCACRQAIPKTDDPTYEYLILGAAIALRNTVPPCHAWMPVHISYEHLICMRNHLVPSDESKKTKIAYDLADLAVVLKKVRENENIRIEHRMVHELLSIQGDFFQLQHSNVRIDLQNGDSSFYNDEFKPCHHYSIKLSALRLNISHSIRGKKRHVVGHIDQIRHSSTSCGTDESCDWKSSGGFWSSDKGCEACETEWICKIEQIDGSLHVFFGCIRRLGHGKGLSGDPTWISAVSSHGAQHRNPGRFALYKHVCLRPAKRLTIIGESDNQRILGGVRNIKFFPESVGDTPLSYYADSEDRFFMEWKV